MNRALQEDKKILKTVLWFANLKRIKSTDQIEKKFEKLSMGEFQVIEPENTWAYEHDRDALRGRLEKLIQSERGRQEVEQEIAHLLTEKVHPWARFEGLKLVSGYDIDGIEAACALALALLTRKDYINRLKQCGNPKCEKFRLNEKRKGQSRRHCNNKCKARYDALTGSERTIRSRNRRRD